MSFKTISAILKGLWLIEPAYVRSHLPLIAKMLNGELHGEHFEASFFKKNHNTTGTNHLPVRLVAARSPRAVFNVGPGTSLDRISESSIVQVSIIGPVLKYGDICSYGTADYTDLFLRLASSDRVKGIVLNIDSPGGEAAGTSLLAKTITDVTKSKPVIAIIQDGMAASAAMWIAASAQEIYVTESTDMVGSIGAYQLLYDYRGYLEQNGVKEHLIMAPQSSDKIKDYLDALEGDYTAIKEHLEFLVDEFISSVKKGRGGRLKTEKGNPFTGKMYRAAEAKRIGLIDGVKSFGQVLTRMEELLKLSN